MGKRQQLGSMWVGKRVQDMRNDDRLHNDGKSMTIDDGELYNVVVLGNSTTRSKTEKNEALTSERW
jgi:hypothetical protein